MIKAIVVPENYQLTATGFQELSKTQIKIKTLISKRDVILRNRSRSGQFWDESDKLAVEKINKQINKLISANN